MLKQLEKSVDCFYAHVPRSRPQKSQIEKTKIIAHRGAHDHHSNILENTEQAFAKALELGCWGIEFDVQACRNKVLVVNHDADLKRLWNKEIRIQQVDFETVNLHAPLVPRLDQIVEEYGKKIHLFIEIKAPFSAFESLHDTLKPLNPIEDFHLISLNETLLETLGQWFPKSALLLVPVHHNVRQFCRLSLQKNYGGVLGHYLLMRNSWVQKLKEARQIAGVGFIDSQYSLYREINRGLQYLFTNNAALVMRCLNELSSMDEPFSVGRRTL